MVGDEFADPMGTEFDKTLAEINFGAGVAEALKNLARRVDCPDLHFFVVAILIQRETGGNLAEIAENIAQLIRKRFELQDRVRALAAEGKLSAIVLFALPFLLALAISVVNPSYLGVLFTDPIGKGMLGVAAVMMVTGAIVIKKMIHIKV
jgi:tight adherence protein B